VAAALGLGYPGGPIVDRLAELGDPSAFAFTSPRIKDPVGALDFSFSGLKTMVIRVAQGLSALPLGDPGHPPQAVLDLLASFRRTIVDWLLAPLDDLVARTNRRWLPRPEALPATVRYARVLPPGIQARDRDPASPVALTTDNAAMIARAGQLRAARAS